MIYLLTNNLKIVPAIWPAIYPRYRKSKPSHFIILKY